MVPLLGNVIQQLAGERAGDLQKGEVQVHVEILHPQRIAAADEVRTDAGEEEPRRLSQEGREVGYIGQDNVRTDGLPQRHRDTEKVRRRRFNSRFSHFLCVSVSLCLYGHT